MKQIIYILVLLLMTSCYEDKGNYDYHQVNKLAIELETEYAIRLDKDTIVTIAPQISQSMRENMSNLRYIWLHSTVNENFYGLSNSYGFDTVGTTQVLKFHIDPEEKNLKYEHFFRLNVYDSVTGIEYPVNTKIKLIKPYDGAWMILHSNNGQTELGSVEYIGGKTVSTSDAYYKETGKRFQGRPLCLGRMTTSCKYYGTGSGWNMFSVMTDIPREAGVYCQWKKFEKKDSLIRMVAPLAQNGFNFQKVKQIDGDGNAGGLLLSDGVFYQTPRAMKVYKPATTLEGEVKITQAAKTGSVSLVYDEAGHRFAFYYNTSDGSGVKKFDPLYFSEGEENIDLIKPIPVRDGNSTEADPNHLDPAQKVLYIGSGYNYEPSYSGWLYNYALTRKGENCFIYEFNARGMTYTGTPSFNAYYSINKPKELNENSCFTSSAAFSGIIFFTSGNKVYRLDFKQAGGKVTAVYTHTGGKATHMQFARKSLIDKNNYKAYEFNLNRSLGVSFDMGNGKSDFVILNLSSTGSIGPDSENYPALQVYSGFGEVVDFVFI